MTNSTKPSDDSIWQRLEEEAILRRAREDVGLTQDEFAKRIGRQAQWISQCERGVSLLSDVDIGKIRHVHPEAYTELSKRRLQETLRALQISSAPEQAAREHAVDVALTRAEISQAHAILGRVLRALGQSAEA